MNSLLSFPVILVVGAFTKAELHDVVEQTARRVLQEAIPQEPFDVNPSKECATNKSPWFVSFLSDLRIFPAKSTGWDGDCWEVTAKDVSIQPIKFTFSWSGGEEKSSYIPVHKYLCDIGLEATLINNGQGLPDGFLFKQYLYMTRTIDPNLVKNAQEQDRFLPCIGRIQGLSDVAVWKRNTTLDGVGSSNFSFFIEIKLVDDLRNSRDRCFRETILQLVGVNARNSNSSPPIILTNLAETHFILYLEADDSALFRFNIRVLRCKRFDIAVQYVREQLLDGEGNLHRTCITEYLGRRKITPIGTPSKEQEHVVDEDEEVEEEFEKVQFSPLKTIEQSTEVDELAIVAKRLAFNG